MSGLFNFRTETAATKGNNRHSGYARHAEDWYIEPAWAVEALLKVEAFQGQGWDPACGAGNIPLTFERVTGRRMQGSDIVDRADEQFPRCDFLSQLGGLYPGGVYPIDFIISNPPYGLAEKFARKACAITTRKVAFILRLAFLESEARLALWRETPLARVHVFARRVSMPPGGRAIKAEGGYYAFAWFVWDQEHSGPPVIGWLP